MKLSIRSSISLANIVIVVIISTVAATISFYNGHKDVIYLVSDLQVQTYLRIHKLIENFIELPQRLNKDILFDIETGLLTTNNPDRIGQHMYHIIQKYPSIISIKYADHNRNIVGPAREHPKKDWRF